MSSTNTAFDYDPSTPEFQERIWDVYRNLRDHHPVYHDVRTGSFSLSRFDDVRHAATDWQTFSSVVSEAQTLLPQMIFMDPPRHTALRALVSRAFTPRWIADMESLARDTARDLLAPIAERGTCEFQHEYAAALPSVVIARMIGVSDDHIPAFRQWTESFLEIQGSSDYADAAARIYALFAELLEERRRRPAQDLMSALIGAEIDGQRLTDDELLGFCLLLILAGNDTTSSLIGNGIVLLARHPDQRQLLLAQPHRWPAAVEEITRIESPAQVLSRTATRDITRHDVTIPAGSRVMLIWGSANHDEREFADPERFDVTRDASRHLAFSRGPHFCLGANLARLEARVAFEEWHARFPTYQLGEPRRITSIWARAHAAIPLRVRP